MILTDIDIIFLNPKPVIMKTFNEQYGQFSCVSV